MLRLKLIHVSKRGPKSKQYSTEVNKSAQMAKHSTKIHQIYILIMSFPCKTYCRKISIAILYGSRN